MSQDSLYKYSQYNIVVEEKEDKVLIYNTIQHRWKWIPKSDFYDIKDNCNIDLGDVPIYLAKDGFIVPTSTNELHSERPYKIQHVDFEVTPFCNESCIHCFNHWRTNSDKEIDLLYNKSITEENYRKIAEKIIELHPREVVITGGEPLSVFDKIRPALDLLTQNEIIVKINTNGGFLNDEIAKYLANNKMSTFISFPCADKNICNEITGVKNSFEIISKAIRTANNNNVQIVLNMVITKLNLEYIFSTAEYVKNELGVNAICITKAMMPCRNNSALEIIVLNKEEFKAMLDSIIQVRDQLGMNVDSAWEYSLCGFEKPEHIRQFAFKRKCVAGSNHICISWNGDIKPCSVNNTVYGNIIKDDISEVMKKMKCWRDNSLLSTECLECKHLKYCGGGCRLDAENTYGDVHHIDSTANPNNKDIDYENYYKQFLQKNIKASGKYS